VRDIDDAAALDMFEVNHAERILMQKARENGVSIIGDAEFAALVNAEN